MITLETWKVERLHIERTQNTLEKLQYISSLINQAQQEHDEHIRWTELEIADWLSDLKLKTLKKAEGRKAAAIRLRKYFNTIANEIQL